jgi:hypothetical protein
VKRPRTKGTHEEVKVETYIRRAELGRVSDLIRTGSLRLCQCIDDASGLAFLHYDPILLESPTTTYLVEWGEVLANRNSRTYIVNPTMKNPELHTFIYAQRKVHHHSFTGHRS